MTAPATATTPGPESDAEVPAYLRVLGLPGLADVHVHFLPEQMLAKVWRFFGQAEEHYGRAWPVQYKLGEPERVERLRSLGLRRIPALTYAHKPGMAEWLNDWGADFARRTPGAVHCATFYPEPGVGDYVARALETGAELFKVHVQVGRFAPDDPRLDPVWTTLQARGVPTVLHAGSGPLPGPETGPGPVRRVLQRCPELPLVVAHMGMPEYHEFADLAEEFPHVHLDTTMVGTDFTEAFAPMPLDYVERLPGLVDRIVLGSDFPNIPYPYAHQLQALARLGLGDEWMRKVLWHNGARLLDIAESD